MFVSLIIFTITLIKNDDLLITIFRQHIYLWEISQYYNIKLVQSQQWLYINQCFLLVSAIVIFLITMWNLLVSLFKFSIIKSLTVNFFYKYTWTCYKGSWFTLHWNIENCISLINLVNNVQKLLLFYFLFLLFLGQLLVDINNMINPQEFNSKIFGIFYNLNLLSS